MVLPQENQGNGASLNMQGGNSEPLSPSADTHVAKDPRLRVKTSSLNIADTTASRGHSHAHGGGDYLGTEGTSASGMHTPQGSLTKPQVAQLTLSDATALEKALGTFVSTAVDSSLSKRRRDRMQAESRRAQVEYERAQRSYSQFPVFVEHALEKQKKVDVDYEHSQQEARRNIEAEITTTSELVALLLQTLSKCTTGAGADTAQATRNAEFRRHSAQFADLTNKHDTLRKHVGTLQDNVPGLKQENEALRRSVDALEERIKAMEQELRTVHQEAKTSSTNGGKLDRDIQESKERIQQLTARLEELEHNSHGVEALRKSNNLRFSNLQTQLEHAEGQLGSLQKDMKTHENPAKVELPVPQLTDWRDRFTTIEEALESTVDETSTLKRKMSSLEQILAGSSDRVQHLEDSLESHICDWKSLKNKVSGLKLEVSVLAKGANSNLQAQVEGLVERVDKFTSGTARENKARDELIQEEIADINQDLSDRIDHLHQQVMEVQKALEDRPSTPSLSREHLQTLNGVAGLIPKLSAFEADLRKLQSGLEKHSHMIQWQTHRFDNLTSESLARQMIGLVNPVLPKFEAGLVKIDKVEEEMTRFWKRLEHTQTKAERPTEKEHQPLEDVREELKRVKIELGTEYESLASEFCNTRDNVVADVRRLQDSHERAAQQVATLSASTEKRLGEIEHQIETLLTELSKEDGSHAPSPGSRARSASVLFTRTPSAAQRPPYSTVERSNRDRSRRLQEWNGSGKADEEPEEFDVEEIGKEATILLESFQKRPTPPGTRPTATADHTVSEDAGTITQQPKKRKRGDDAGLDGHVMAPPISDETVLVKSQVVPPTAKRKTKTNDR
ncbi:hypothetical protein HRR78_008813 [Exophiala dermatitidis]|nr:hypothetical protein HRR75_008807 [Exophiala dermatitidis]KAJ4535613.1 hypothetical protein HRR78_008813 [Exophiala dermatitidis]